MLALVLVLGFVSMGVLGQNAANFLMGGIVVLGVGTWVYRWYYTRWVRDPAFWSKRTFGADSAKPKQLDVCVGSTATA